MAKLASTRVYGNLIVDNALNIAGQLTSTAATGTAPFAVSSTTTVTNLNADMLDGLHSSINGTANTIAARDGSGYITAAFFKSTNSAENTTASSYFYEYNSDGYLRKKTLANVKTELVTSAAVIAGLGFTPYNATNPSGYINGITSGMVTTALGFTPYSNTNPSGYQKNSDITKEEIQAKLTGDVQLTGVSHADGANAANLELYSPNQTTNHEISMRFHEANTFYAQIRARPSGFHLTVGNDNTYTSLYASTLSIQAAATASAATQIPIFIADPASTTRTLVTRTPAQLRSDIGAGTGNGTVTSVAPGTQVSGLTMTITNGSTTPSIATSISNTANFRSAIGAGTGNGTVTSVTGTANHISVATGTTTPVISLATAFGDTINPYASKTANYILAAPSGSAGVPSFRALTALDLGTTMTPTFGTITTGSAGQTWVIDGSGTNLLFQSGATPTTRMIVSDIGLNVDHVYTAQITGPDDYLTLNALSGLYLNMEAGSGLLPLTTNINNLGSSSLRFANVYATNYYGSGANLTEIPKIITNTRTSTLTVTTATAADITSVVLTSGKTYRLSFLAQLGRNAGSSKTIGLRVYCSSTSQTIAGKMYYNATESASYDTPVLINNASSTNYGTASVASGTTSMSQIWVKGELFVAGTGQTVKLQLVTTGTFGGSDQGYCYRGYITAIEL